MNVLTNLIIASWIQYESALRIYKLQRELLVEEEEESKKHDDTLVSFDCNLLLPRRWQTESPEKNNR